MIWKWKKFDELSLFELYNIIQVREEVFVVEQKLSYVDCDDYDQKAWHLMGYENEKLVAYMRVFEPGVKYAEAAFGRVLTTKLGRGKGYGKDLTQTGIQKILSTFGNVPVKISAQKYLEAFYGEYGFKRISEDYLEEGIPHVSMIRPID